MSEEDKIPTEEYTMHLIFEGDESSGMWPVGNRGFCSFNEARKYLKMVKLTGENWEGVKFKKKSFFGANGCRFIKRNGRTMVIQEFTAYK